MTLATLVFALILQATPASQPRHTETRESSQTRIDIDLKEVPATDVLDLIGRRRHKQP